MSNRFTEKAERALNKAVQEAEALGHTYIGSEHVLLSLANVKDSTAALILEKNGLSYAKIFNAVKEYSGVGTRSNLTPKDMTPRCRKIVENSYRISLKYSSQKIGTENILLSIIEEKDCIAVKLLSFIGTDLANISDELITILRTAEKHFESSKNKKDGGDSYLSQYGKNLTELALRKKLDPVIGRSKETERLIRILSRKTKNNPCLIGEAGVGKTAIVEGLAAKIAMGDVPPQIKGKKIISIDLTSMVAGAKYRGDFEERIKNLINEASKNKSVILFIDEIHTIVGAGSAEGAIDAANILKPQLSRAEIQLIGATTFAEYHKYIEKDAALERRFQELIVEEPTVMETIEMLNGVKKKYEEHHGVNISDEAISAAVKLSERYIQDRFFPDKAFDVLDEACARANMKVDSKSEFIGENIKQNKKNKIDAIRDGNYDLALKLHNSESEFNIESELSGYTEIIDNGARKTVTETDVKMIINEMTGIPLSGISSNLNINILKRNLENKIFGQTEAINSLVQAVMRSEAGINNPEKPKGVFLFIGSSGVGKTELATALSEELFHNKKSLIRYDMSEFSEKNSVTMLIGSPPGYVGYEEGGALTEKVRRHPYSLLLFDEIEKAHPDVLNLFLQIMDNGILTDSCGRSVSFKNTYIIMTSNALNGMNNEKNMGFLSQENIINNDKIYDFFTPEFISRIDSVIYFAPLTKSAMKEIAKKRLKSFAKRVADMKITLIYDDNVSDYIAEKAKDKKLGARLLLRFITTEIENKVSVLILSGNIDKIIIDIADNELKITPIYRIEKKDTERLLEAK